MLVHRHLHVWVVGRSVPVRRALLVGAMLLLVWGLAACAPVSASTSAPAATAQPQQCGSVVIAAGQRVTTDTAAQSENCFWQAFSHCQAASLTVTTMGVDTGVVRIFTTKQAGSGCMITDQAQSYRAPNYKGPLQTYTCAGVAQRQGGLLFQSCGADGDIAVPPLAK
jgi:hypothetical protein